MSTSFWGLQLAPKKIYRQEVEESFHVSMVALGAQVKGNTRGTLIVKVDDEEHAVCSLIPGNIEQQLVDLNFSAGETISFQITGENDFHLTGVYMPEDEGVEMDSDEEEEDDEEIDSDIEVPSDEETLRRMMMGDDSADSEMDDESEPELVMNDEKIVEVQEEEEEPPKLVEAKKRPAPEPETATPVSNKKTKAEKKKDAAAAKVAAAAATNSTTPPKTPEVAAAKPAETKKADPLADLKKAVDAAPAEKKAVDKKVEKKDSAPAEKPAAEKKVAAKAEAPADDKKRVLPSGLVIEEIKKGDGARVKNGKKVLMRYIGKLTNGKEFDSNKTGKPFAFTLGRSEVIKGWDIGVQGMQVGGVRRLTIPPKLAYGASGAPPDIPKNATLVFDVKVVDVK